MSLNALKTVEGDPTILRGTCIVFDFEPNRHAVPSVITKEVAQENMQTLIGKRISCKYIKQEDNYGQDALGDHEEDYESLDRNGNEVLRRDTEAIGFIEDVFIDTYKDESDNEKEAVFANIVIWNDDKYSDIVGLLKEWLDNDIAINMSCEYYYYNYEVLDGIEYIKSPIIFNAHTLLNSEDRGDYMLVEPAYKNSTLVGLNNLDKWNKAVCQLNSKKIKNNNIKEEDNKMENKFLTALNAMSFGDIKWELYYNELAKVMTAKEYETVYMSIYDVYDDHFNYTSYDEEKQKYITYKVNYTIDENDNITINYEGRTVVEYVLEEKEVALSKDNSIKNNKKKCKELEKELSDYKEKVNALNETIVELNNKNVEISNNAKNEASKEIEELKTMVNSLKPLADKYKEEQFNKSLNSAKEKFKESFTKANAIDVFEEESTQNLIKEYASLDVEISNNAKNKLNALIVENMNIELNSEPKDEDDIMQDNTRISINSVQKLQDTEELVETDSNDIYAQMGIC